MEAGNRAFQPPAAGGHLVECSFAETHGGRGPPMAQYLVFDIETRVDKELVKQVYDPENTLTLEQAYDAARSKLLETQQSDFFPIPYHLPIAIATLQADENYRIRSLACSGIDRFGEPELVCRF